MLHPSKIRRRCDTCGEDVPWEHVVHGYEFQKDRYVVLSDEGVDAIPLKRSRSMDIVEFVKA